MPRWTLSCLDAALGKRRVRWRGCGLCARTLHARIALVVDVHCQRMRADEGTVCAEADSVTVLCCKLSQHQSCMLKAQNSKDKGPAAGGHIQLYGIVQFLQDSRQDSERPCVVRDRWARGT